MKKTSIRKLTSLAIIIAISIILSKLLGFYITPSVRISFEYFPIIFAGIWFGPVAGAVIGALADIIGGICIPTGGAYFPLITVGPVIAGAVAGILSKYFFKEEKSFKSLIIISVISDLLGNLLWGTYALSVLYSTGYMEFLAIRTPFKLLIIAIDAMFVYTVSRALKGRLAWTRG